MHGRLVHVRLEGQDLELTAITLWRPHHHWASNKLFLTTITDTTRIIGHWLRKELASPLVTSTHSNNYEGVHRTAMGEKKGTHSNHRFINKWVTRKPSLSIIAPSAEPPKPLSTTSKTTKSSSPPPCSNSVIPEFLSSRTEARGNPRRCGCNSPKVPLRGERKRGRRAAERRRRPPKWENCTKSPSRTLCMSMWGSKQRR
mmetsp:Transcript_46446/g.68644  ORF Transcript_46446/g.68644 Transcript_46446/m.68644 type:complete len:200 (-) Transcript_46446:368-967(-)